MQAYFCRSYRMFTCSHLGIRVKREEYFFVVLRICQKSMRGRCGHRVVKALETNREVAGSNPAFSSNLLLNLSLVKEVIDSASSLSGETKSRCYRVAYVKEPFTFTYPLTTRVTGAPQMTLQPVSLLSLLHCPLGRFGEL